MSHNRTLPATLNSYIGTDFAVSTKTSADYTVLAPFSICPNNDMYFREDIIRERLEPLETVTALLDMAERHDVLAIAIEKGVISHAIMPTLRTMMTERGKFFVVWEKTPTKDKRARGTPFKARMQQGKVYFPDTPFFHEFVIPELLAFPAGKNDDIFDAMSIGCTMLDELNPPPPDETEEEDVIPQDSYDGMMARVKNRDFSRLHVPRRLNGDKRVLTNRDS